MQKRVSENYANCDFTLTQKQLQIFVRSVKRTRRPVQGLWAQKERECAERQGIEKSGYPLC